MKEILRMKKTENNLPLGVIEDLYELSQVAQILRCSRKTIYRLISSGRLEAVRWGRSYRFRRQDVQEFVRGSLISHRRVEGRATQLTR
jgi:excisionase family DNA binding protein